VRRSANRMRITAQLIDARKDEHLWSQTFDRDIGDIFQVQQEIAFAVAAALKLSLLASDEFRMRKHGTSDPEAYRLYLIAQAHLLNRARGSNENSAKRALDAALARDPNFAAAHAGLAQYYFNRAWGALAETEESARLGTAEAERAVTLDPTSSDAAQARANFRFWHYRFGGDYQSFLAARSEMYRAIELDPSNSSAFSDFGHGILWDEPDLASSMLEQSMQIDVLHTAPSIYIAVLSGSRGQLDSARNRCEELLKRYRDAVSCRMAIATLDSYFGNFQPAVVRLRASESIGGAARIELWSVLMSLGDRAGALEWVDFGSRPFEKALSEAARFEMDGHYDLAFTTLEQHRKEYPLSHLLDYPSAKVALIAGKPRAALEILEKRVPDIVNGVEPITARNLLPAIDLATAQFNTGEREQSRALLTRIATYLDGATVLRLPLFTFERARVHALAGETEAALSSLETAYEQGFRTTWGLDLRPQSLLYIDPVRADPSLDTLRSDPRFMHWLERITADNARQLEQLRTHDATRPTG
jgi:Tfp pilus assembly protein PilF